MDIEQLIDSITPQIYENLKRSVETGKWPDGRPVTQEQRENSMQAIIAYDLRHKTTEDRVGYVAPKPSSCDTDHDADTQQPLKWQE